MQLQIVITGDPTKGTIQVSGPIDDMRIVHWMLGEARRVCERCADSKDAAEGNGKPDLVIAPGAMLRMPPK